MSGPWDDWVKTCGKPTVWCGFDWPEIVENYVVLPQPSTFKDRRLQELIRCLLDNDPDDDAADGVTVLDVWRKEARAVLAYGVST